MLKYIKRNYSSVFLILILFLTLFLRIFRLTDNPPSLNWDEVSIGYNAFSVANFGYDEWGKILPAIFRAYGDYKLPGYIYVLVPFIKIFGLNEFAIRLPSVLAGTLTVFFTYLLVKELFTHNFFTTSRNKSSILSGDEANITAILSALLVAVEPWSLFLSRPAFEANLALCFFTFGFYLFVKSLSLISVLPYALTFFGLTVWTYNSYRIFTPLFIVLIFFVFKKELSDKLKLKKLAFINLFILFLFFVPMIYQTVMGVGQERYKKVAIVDSGAVGKIEDLRKRNNFPPMVEKIIYNRPVYFFYTFSKNIFSHYSSRFLFFEGGDNYQFSVPGYGLLYKIDLIFMLVGLVYFIKIKNRLSLLIFFWLLMGVIPSSLTREAPHALRSITLLPVPMIVIAVGVMRFWKWLQDVKKLNGINAKKISWLFVYLYVAILVFSLKGYMEKYFSDYRVNYSWSWQYGYKQVVLYVKNNYQNYDKIIITKKYGEPHEFFMSYFPLNINDLSTKNEVIRYKQSDWFWVDKIGKLYFVNDWDIPVEEWQKFILESKKEEIDCRNIKCLLVTSPENVPKTWRWLYAVNFLDGRPAYEIYKNE